MAELHEILSRIWEDLVARPSGPMAFRFLIQPVVATVLGVRDGLKDAREGRSPYFWTVLSDPAQRWPRLREGLAATARVLGLGLIIDAIYQLRALGTFYPSEAVIIALVLGFVPYLLIRGPAARIARRWQGHVTPSDRRS